MGLLEPDARHHGGLDDSQVIAEMAPAARCSQLTVRAVAFLIRLKLLEFRTRKAMITMQFKKLTDFTAEQLAGKRVFIRADFNVPQDDAGNITDDTRIRAALAGVRFALDAGARVMVTSHLGRPVEGALLPRDSLAPVAQCLSQHLGQPVRLVPNWMDGSFVVSPGEVVVLENCRGNVGEKSNDTALAKTMAALCDIYVNDAFGTAHRAEASTEGIARHAKIACAGPLMAAELDALTT